MRRLVGPELLHKLNEVVDRQGSRSRRFAKVISGGVTQMSMDQFGCHELGFVSRLAAELVESPVIRQAADALWGDGVTPVSLCTASRLVLEGGSEQIPHADALFPNAIVVLVSMKEGQAPTLVHAEAATGRTAFYDRLPKASGDARQEEVEEMERAALDVISVVSRPAELRMVPMTDTPLNVGDGLLMATSVVHAGPGGLAADGGPRRVAFITIERADSSHDPEHVPYEQSTQYHPTQYWWSILKDDSEAFFWRVSRRGGGAAWERGLDLGWG